MFTIIPDTEFLIGIVLVFKFNYIKIARYEFIHLKIILFGKKNF